MKNLLRNNKGVALVLVLLITVVLTTIIVELFYTTSVTADISANNRDELKATYLAKSAFNFSKVFLKLDAQLASQVSDQVRSLTESAGLGGISLGGLDPETMHIWDFLPISYPPQIELLKAMAGSESSESDAEEEKKSQGQEENVPDETFEVIVEDESLKINLNNFFTEKPTNEGEQSVTYSLLLNIMRQKEFDELFQDEETFKRENLIYSIIDWIDSDFEGKNPRSSKDENAPYYKQEHPYKAKNAKMDSTDELLLIDGWTDDFYQAFRKYVTVYGDGKINVKTAPKEVLAALFNDNVQDKPERAEKLATARTGKKITPEKFFPDMVKEVFDGETDAIKYFWPDMVRSPQKYISTQGNIFKVNATGDVRGVKKTITAIVDRGTDMAAEMKILYWRIR